MKFYLKKIETTSKRKISDNINKRQRPTRLPIAYRFSELVPCGICLGSVLLGNASYIGYTLQHGPNPTNVARRPHGDSEIWALKLSHRIFPQENHRIHVLARLKKNTNPSFLLKDSMNHEEPS